MAGRHVHIHLHRTSDGGPGSGPQKSSVIKPVSSTTEEQQHQQRIKTAHELGVEPEHMYPKHQRRAGDPRLTEDGGPGSGPHTKSFGTKPVAAPSKRMSATKLSKEERSAMAENERAYRQRQREIQRKRR